MKEIFIRRHEIESFLPPDIVSTGMQRIGSVMSGNGPLRGLSFEDEKKYLPALIGVDGNSPDFSKAATAYWSNLSIPVPIDGYKLNVGVLENGEPESIKDWVEYQFILKHPHVERSKGAAEASFKARFYIHDPDEETERKNKRTRLELSAMAELTTIMHGSDPEVTMRRLTRVLISQNPDRLTREQMENALMDVAKTDPERFLSAAQNKKLELHDLVIQLEEAGVIQKIGAQFRYNDDILAQTLDEMIAFLSNSRNSRVMTEMRAKLEEATKHQAA